MLVGDWGLGYSSAVRCDRDRGGGERSVEVLYSDLLLNPSFHWCMSSPLCFRVELWNTDHIRHGQGVTVLSEVPKLRISMRTGCPRARSDSASCIALDRAASPVLGRARGGLQALPAHPLFARSFDT